MKTIQTVQLVKASPKFCTLCNRFHELINWTFDRYVYRCNGCHSYGGPEMVYQIVEVEIPEPEVKEKTPDIHIIDPEPVTIIEPTQGLEISVVTNDLELEYEKPSKRTRQQRQLKSRRKTENTVKRSRHVKKVVG